MPHRHFLLYLFLSSGTFAGNHTNVELPGGSISFQGKIIAEACRVELGSSHLTVIMGTVSSNRFLTTGHYSDSVPFEIRLQDCSTSVSQSVSISFRGVSDRENPDLLSISKGGEAASGVAVAIFNENNQLLPVNSDMTFLNYIPKKGPLNLKFSARYRSTTSTITGGAANAEALFFFTYR